MGIELSDYLNVSCNPAKSALKSDFVFDISRVPARHRMALMADMNVRPPFFHAEAQRRKVVFNRQRD